MKKRKKIWVPIVSVLLVCAIGAGVAVYLTHRPKTPVHVYNISENYLWTEYWGDTATTSGIVTTDKLQTVYVSATQEVTEVYVQPGQKITKGTPLMAYDTTLSQLSLDRASLEIERSKLRLEDAQDQLAEIKKMRPITYTTTPATTKPTTKATEATQPSDATPTREFNTGEDFMVLSGQGTAGSPRIVWAKQDTTFDDDVLAALLGSASLTYVVVEVRDGDKAAGDVISRIGMEISVAMTKVSASGAQSLRAVSPADAADYGVQLLTDVEPTPTPDAETEEPAPSETTDPTEPSEPTNPTEPSDPDPTQPDPGETYVEVPRYSIVFFQADSLPAAGTDTGSSGSGAASSGGTTVNVNSGYTTSEIAQMRADKEAEIKELEFSIQMAEAEYSIMQKEFDNGVVTSEIDGYVVSVLTPEEALASNEPMIKVSGGGGFLIQGTVSELKLNTLTLGQTVDVRSWETGMSYVGTITAIGDYPVESNDYNAGNPNVSYYPFTVTIDESANLQTGYYAQITYSSNTAESDGFYLEMPFVRSENGTYYVYVQGEEGLLEKREIQTGPTIYDGNYIKVLSGLEVTDAIAFPYGSNLKVGAPTEEAEISELYGIY